MDSLRQNTILREVDPTTEIEFPGSGTSREPSLKRPQPGFLATVKLLYAGRRRLYRVAMWAIVISAVFAFLIPNQYESSVRIMPPESMNSAANLMTMLTGKANPELMALAGSVLGMKGSGALFVDLFRSRSVQERVVDRLNLQQVYRARYKQDARKKLDSRTDVSEDRKSGVITLIVEDHSPQRARDIAQAYVEELNRVLAQVSTSSARRERIFIEQRLVTVKDDLEDAEKQFSSFASKNTALDIKEQTKAMVESSAMLQGQLIAAQTELQSLEQIYTPNNVRVRATQARVHELEHQMQNIRGSDSSLQTDTDQPDQIYPSVRKLPLLGVQWADLYRRAKIQETVYELLTQQYELARIQEAKEIPSVNAVDTANVPEKKSWPPRLLIIILLTLLSVAGGVAWIVGSARIESMEPNDPRREMATFAGDVLNRFHSRIATHKFLARFNGSKPRDQESE